MVLLLRTHRESRSVMQLTQLLLLGAGGSLIFNNDLDSALALGQMTIHTLGFLGGPSRSWTSGINRVAVWSLDNLYTEEQCWTALRFRKADLPLLHHALRLPDHLLVRHSSEHRRGKHHIFSGMEALVVFLARMSSCSTWEQHLLFLGGRSRPAYVNAFYAVLEHIYTNYAHCITDITRWADWGAIFARAVTQAGGPAPRTFGFIDGTIRVTCRPTLHQRQAYTGYGRRHGIKFQSVVSPNGMIVDLFGPLLARRGDGHMLRVSNILARMAALVAAAGEHYYLYGDPAYPLHRFLLRGFKGAMSAQQQAFSTSMSSVRESVEWGYQIIVTLFPFLDKKRAMQILKLPVGKLYIAAAIMANVHNCFYGNQILAFFQHHYSGDNLAPPCAEDYLNL